MAVVMVLVACSHQNNATTSIDSTGDIASIGEDGGLDNVMSLKGDVINGSAPKSDAAFDALAAMGVKTIVSVDGARPDIEAADERGMRYVHIPIGYDDVTPEEARQIALALRDLPRPIYMHCHHGKHRGPAAIAVGMVCTGEMTNDEAVSFMEVAGTSHSYPGLFESAQSARPIDWSGDVSRGDDLPKVMRVAGFVNAMSSIDRTWDRLKVIQTAQWQTPANHPDLVPAAEAGMLVDLLRVSIESKYAVRPGSTGAMVASADEDDMMAPPTAQITFNNMLSDALIAANGLEDSLVSGNAQAADMWFTRLKSSCSACHEQFRN